MTATVLITGASTGIGNLTARALALAGHRVYASMRGIDTRNAHHAQELADFAAARGVDLTLVDLDVQSQASVDAAVQTVLDDAGQLDVVINNAGHLVIGYVEAFTADDLVHLFDINVIGVQRVNRAVLPILRAQRAGTLLYVGSTSIITTPPFLGPYVASKAAFDLLALTTAYELHPFGIETVIVMPGAFTQGTMHFPNASHASDADIARHYTILDPLLARNEDVINALFPPDVDADPQAVADEIVRILALPAGAKPLRSVVDFTNSGVDEANALIEQTRERFVERMTFGELLKPTIHNQMQDA